MKKSIMLAIAAIVAVVLITCQSSNKESKETARDTYTYMGTLPAADGPGIVYKLTIKDLKEGSGTFDMDMTYLEAEEGSDQTFSSKGILKTIKGSPQNSNDTIYQLINEKNEVTNFLLRGDKTLRLLNEKLEHPDLSSSLNYDIILID